MLKLNWMSTDEKGGKCPGIAEWENDGHGGDDDHAGDNVVAMVHAAQSHGGDKCRRKNWRCSELFVGDPEGQANA